MNNFVQYIAGLAETGETALVVLQKQTATGFVWLPQLPSAKMKDGKAWYMNTGSFMLDRMPKKLSASKGNVEYVLCMMLDDIGTKAKVPPLQPTWIIETSKGSFQYGYTFSEQPTKAEFVAAITAIAEAGYTDPGSCNAVRNFRVPGSINLKEGKGRFASVLVEFTPEREYSLAQICAALEVSPILTGGKEVTPLHLKDTGKDTVLAWLNEQSMVLSPVNDQGWLSVLCPNHGEHSDGQVFARYHPVDRAFKCYHGHCVDLDSKTYLKWVQDNGGPSTQPGLREDLMSQVMTEALSKLTPVGMYKEDAEKVMEDIELKELGRVAKSDWYKRFAYVVEDDVYFDTYTRRVVSRKSFNALYRHIMCASIHSTRRVESSICYDENRQNMNGTILAGLTYAAGDETFVAYDGDVMGNTWSDARPKVDKSATKDISLWVSHCRDIVPNDSELEHIWDVMAFKLQNPKVKINHAILHGGDEGCGKDTMWAPFLWSVCGPRLRNRGILDGNSISSKYGYQLESEVLLINELKEPNAADRRVLANNLKPLIAAPPDTLPVEKKFLHTYMVANRLFVLAFSNDPVPISLSSQDRRWFCVWSPNAIMEESRSKEIWGWYNAGGFEAVAAWLYQRNVAMFNPAAAPAMTEFKLNMLEHGMSSAESFLVEMIRERSGEFAAGIIGGPFHAICDRVSGLAPQGVTIYQAALLHALKEAGWKDCGRLSSSKYATKKHIFATPELARSLNKSDLRNRVEEHRDNIIRILAK